VNRGSREARRRRIETILSRYYYQFSPAGSFYDFRSIIELRFLVSTGFASAAAALNKKKSQNLQRLNHYSKVQAIISVSVFASVEGFNLARVRVRDSPRDRSKSANIHKTMGSGRTVAEILQSPSDLSAWAYKRAIAETREGIAKGRETRGGKDSRERRTSGILCGNETEHPHERPSDTNQLEAIKNLKGYASCLSSRNHRCGSLTRKCRDR